VVLSALSAALALSAAYAASSAATEQIKMMRDIAVSNEGGSGLSRVSTEGGNCAVRTSTRWGLFRSYDASCESRGTGDEALLSATAAIFRKQPGLVEIGQAFIEAPDASLVGLPRRQKPHDHSAGMVYSRQSCRILCRIRNGIGGSKQRAGGGEDSDRVYPPPVAAVVASLVSHCRDPSIGVRAAPSPRDIWQCRRPLFRGDVAPAKQRFHLFH